MILIGSGAIKHYFPNFPREPKDYDFIVQRGDWVEKPYWIPKEMRVEYHNNEVFENYLNSFMRPDDLLTLKCSHVIGWDINWNKHMWDIQWLLDKGVKIKESLMWKLYEYWNIVHGVNKRSDLDMSKEDFFTNAINYNTLEHDEIHKILNPEPTYTKILKAGEEVLLDEGKWKELSEEDKIKLIQEEIMVMGYERFKQLGYRGAYSKMLTKFIISHAPKFTLVFILQNYKKLIKAPYNFIKKIDKCLQID